MTSIVITAHAALRYRQRFAPSFSLEECRDAIRSHSAAILKAHAFGCHAVLTGIGAKLIVHDECGAPTVVTVKHAHHERTTSTPRKMVKRFGKLRRAGAGL